MTTAPISTVTQSTNTSFMQSIGTMPITPTGYKSIGTLPMTRPGSKTTGTMTEPPINKPIHNLQPNPHPQLSTLTYPTMDQRRLP